MIDLMLYCATKADSRKALQQPFRFGPYVYATNGHIAVRVTADGMDYPEGVELGQRIDAMMDEGPEAADQYVPVPVPADPWMIVCPDCLGEKREPQECPDCHGKGEVEHTYWATNGDMYT